MRSHTYEVLSLMPQAATKSLLINIRQVSQLVGVPVGTLRDQRYRSQGLGALGFPVDGRIMFERAEVEEYIANAKRQDRLDRQVAE